MTGLNIILTQVAFFIRLFPGLIISSFNQVWSLTLYNACAAPYALVVMSIVSLIFIPAVPAREVGRITFFATV